MFVPQETLGDIPIQFIPLVNPTTFLEMIVVDMIESLIPRFKPLFLQLDNLLTKSAPESRLSVPPDLMSFELLPDVIVVLDLMSIPEMGLE